jgi:hypothetical protein
VVTGKILSSELVYVPGRSSHDRADVTYNYSVNGTQNTSHQISLWSSDLSSYGGITRAFVANHTNGSPVNVYYDPEHPENAVLIPGADEKMDWLLMGMGGFCALTGIGGLIARLRKEPRLRALLSDPAAETRTIAMHKADIIRGQNALGVSILLGGFTFVLSAAYSAIPYFSGPSNLPGAMVPAPGQWLAGVVCAIVAFFIVRYGIRQAHRAECPLCGNFTNKAAFKTGRCEGCGTRIIFDGVPVPAAPRTDTPRSEVIRGFHKDRFIDVAGFMAFPILFAWLCNAAETRTGPGLAVLMTLLFSMLGGVFYFCPQTMDNKTPSTASMAKAEETEEKTQPHWLDFGIILTPPVILLSYLLYLVWSKQTLDTPGLVTIVIGFPLALVAITYICKYRFIRDEKSKAPKPPAYVPLTLIALWLGGTFISVLFLACLVFKLMGHK